MTLKKIKELLELEKVSYELLEHDQAFTSLQTAEAQHIPGRQFVKSIIVKLEQNFVMCVLPSTYKIDLEKLKGFLQVKDLYLADEAQVAALFPDYEIGAMPPFGHFGGIRVYVEKVLEENEIIAFNAGTHTQVIRIKLADYIRLEKPSFGYFGVHI